MIESRENEASAGDEELIERTLSGERDAFATLISRYQDRLYNTAVLIVRDTEEAKDIVQETFLQAFASLSQFRQSSRFYTWLYQIAFNIAVGVLRRRKRTIPAERLPETTWENLASRGESPEESQTRRESVRMIWTAINRLPIEYRGPVILREIEGASYEQIAKIVEIPVGTVRSRLYRARLMLREMILRQKNDLS